MDGGPRRYQVFFAELKRRQVFKVAAVYGAVAFALMQAADIAFPRLGLPDWTVTFVVALAVLGFPIAVVMAWALELTPEGVKKTERAREGELESIVALPPKRRWPAGLLALAGIALLAVGGWWVYRDAGPESAVADASARPRSIAVLPFSNLSGDEANEYFSDGITDDIITHLTRLSGLKVISRTSAMRYKDTDKGLRQIARELGVATVLEGGVQRSGDRVRINAQLIDAFSDEHLWAEQYNAQLTDVFQIQTDIALKIAGALKAQLSPEEKGQVERAPTEDVEAYNLYLQGRFFWNKRTQEGLQTAIEYFRQALEVDPDYALAWVGLADSYTILANWGYLSMEDTYERAKSAALKALESDESLGEAHVALAMIHEQYEWDMERALAEFERGIALSPGYATGHQWYGGLLIFLGRSDEALAELEQALQLDPLSLIINQNMGNVLRVREEFEAAIEQFQKVERLDPNYPGTYQEIGHAYEDMKAFDDAIRSYRRAMQLSGGRLGIAELGHVYGRTGQTEKAVNMLSRLEQEAKGRFVSPVEFAIVHAGLGDLDKAYEWIDRALEQGDATLNWRIDTPGFDELRSDPRYARLLERLGVAKYRTP